MPMGVVSDKELEEEIKRNGAKEIVIPKPIVRPTNNGGRNEGDVNVPESLRNVIAQDAIENGRESALALAKSFGISSSSVSAYTNGATSTASYSRPSKNLTDTIDKSKKLIAGKAKRRLKWALNGITEEKLNEAGLKTVASVAKDMAVIIKQMEPSDSEGGTGKAGTNVQVVLFAPRETELEDFPRMVVKDT